MGLTALKFDVKKIKQNQIIESLTHYKKIIVK